MKIEAIRQKLRVRREENIQTKEIQYKKKEEKREWGLPTPKQRKLQIAKEIPLNVEEMANNQTKRSFAQEKRHLQTEVLSGNVYYPPTCSGYDIAYCKSTDTIYVYGGISCSSDLDGGIATHFYRHLKGVWSEVRIQSTYSPMPRFGHTLTAYQKDLILFGGVSQYKEKLKDRCFYADCSVFNTVRMNWRVLDTTQTIKPRKNHAACVYGKYYIVHGGLNDSEEVLPEMSWINLECKKARWKTIPSPRLFNHKMIATQMESGKDFLAIFGGRNSASEIVDSLYVVPLGIVDGDLGIRELVRVSHQINPRQSPIMVEFEQGFMVLGGIDENSQIVEDSWYYNGEKQVLEEVKPNIRYSELRGAKGVCVKNEQVYVLASNSLDYKALKMGFAQ